MGHQDADAPDVDEEVEVNEGRKDDLGKTRFELLPSDALEEIAKVLTHGAKKYADRNWERGINWSRCFGACMRHLWSWWRGHDLDAETGLSHLAHAGCCVLFMLAYQLRGMTDFDDRERLTTRDDRALEVLNGR